MWHIQGCIFFFETEVICKIEAAAAYLLYAAHFFTSNFHLPEPFQRAHYFNKKSHNFALPPHKIYLSEIILYLNAREPFDMPNAAMKISMSIYL
jgi:hypothetical protein